MAADSSQHLAKKRMGSDAMFLFVLFWHFFANASFVLSHFLITNV